MLKKRKVKKSSWTYGTLKCLRLKSLESQKEKKVESEKILTEIMAKTSQIWQETETFRFKKLNYSQTQRESHIMNNFLETKEKQIKKFENSQ